MMSKATMNLRARKVKSNPEQITSYNTRYQMAKIKVEPMSSDDDEPLQSRFKTLISRQSERAAILPSVDYTEYNSPEESNDDESPMVDIVTIDSQMPNIKTEVIDEGYNENCRAAPLPCRSKTANHRAKQSKIKKKCTYQCVMCGKLFPHWCRLKTHMPTHTGLKRYRCKLCPKRYVNQSSLTLHIRNIHSAERSAPVLKPFPVKVEPHSKFIPFFEIKVEPTDSIDVETLSTAYTPFVWDDKEMTVKDTANTTRDMTNDMNVLKPSDKENKENYLNLPTPKPRAAKYKLWEKETGLQSYYVDVFEQPKSKRTLFREFVINPRNGKTATGQQNRSNGKSTESAIEQREIGDIEFMKKNWHDAREWYNRSICHAKYGTFHLAIGYAKRAQCFFNMGMYKKCWIDLSMAESAGLPKELEPTLEKHRNSCRMMLNANEFHVDVEPSLSFPADSKFREMANVLEIVCDDTYGRHIIAKEPIGVGKVVLIEKGFVSTTTEHYAKCCICLTGDTNLVPCSTCNRAMVCKRCIGRKYHQIECDLESTNNYEKNQWLSNVVRSILCAIALFDNIDELINFVEMATTLNYMKIPDTIPDMKSKYRAFLQLIDRPALPTDIISMSKRLQTTFLNHKITGRLFTSMKQRRFLSHLILHHYAVINKFGTKTYDNGESGCSEITAPIASYLNHSCAPNASKFLLANSIIVVTMRPIKAGEQLFVSYCDIRKNKMERQSILLENFGFQCQCERCLSPQWPSIDVQQILSDRTRAEVTERFVRENFEHLASTNQEKRKELSERLLGVLHNFGSMSWNHTVNWAYIVYSILVSHRFQNKLQY